MSSDLLSLLPKVSLGRRAAAFCIDGIAVWLPGLLLGTNAIAQTIFFVLLWLILRVAIVRKNQGQSLGRWALDMKIADTRFQRTPGVQEDRKSGSAGMPRPISYAVFCLKKKKHHTPSCTGNADHKHHNSLPTQQSRTH